MNGKRTVKLLSLCMAIATYYCSMKLYEIGCIDERVWFLSQEFEDDNGQKWRLAAKKG